VPQVDLLDDHEASGDEKVPATSQVAVQRVIAKIFTCYSCDVICYGLCLMRNCGEWVNQLALLEVQQEPSCRRNGKPLIGQ